jgi:DNA-directed RNA polymerase subunit RPC12/RpoP
MAKKYDHKAYTILICGKCGKHFKADDFDYQAANDECECCGSHGYIAVGADCPVCKTHVYVEFRSW